MLTNSHTFSHFFILSHTFSYFFKLAHTFSNFETFLVFSFIFQKLFQPFMYFIILSHSFMIIFTVFKYINYFTFRSIFFKRGHEISFSLTLLTQIILSYFCLKLEGHFFHSNDNTIEASNKRKHNYEIVNQRSHYDNNTTTTTTIKTTTQTITATIKFIDATTTTTTQLQPNNNNDNGTTTIKVTDEPRLINCVGLLFGRSVSCSGPRKPLVLH